MPRLRPSQTNSDTTDIKFPYEDVEKEGKKVRKIKAKEMYVTVKLWYMPAGGDPRTGVPGTDQYLLYETSKTVSDK